MFKSIDGLWIGFWSNFWDERYSSTRKHPDFKIKVIDHKKQRYNTVGDYYYNIFGSLVILVSDMGDWRMEYLIAFHELSEIPLCWEAGITNRMIDEFDMEYDSRRKPGDASEPGDDPDCPYFKCHQYASQQEREMCAKFGIDWDEYDNRIAELLNKRAQEEAKK